ncbi:RrF2 family transcriptional regulator [candidate division KSB1 bacterium]
MKLSTKSRYGLRAMLRLAMHYQNNPVQLREIADEEDISVKYLEHLISSLKAAGLVRAIRGARGGYVLTESPSKISLLDIVECLEGKISLVDCVANPELCRRNQTCASRDIWVEINQQIQGTLGNQTLEDLVGDHRRKLQATTDKMYYI